MAENEKKELILCAQCLEEQRQESEASDGETVHTFTFASDPDVKALYMIICPICREDLLVPIPNFLRYGRRLWGNLQARIEDLWPAGDESLLPMVFSALLAGARDLWRMNQTMPWNFEQKKQGHPTDT